MTEPAPRGEPPRTLSRRLWLRAAPLLGFALTLALRGRPAAADAPIAQPDVAGPAAFLDRAFVMRRQAEAAGDQAYGAVVARDGRIVGQAPSAVVTRGDPTAR